MSKRNTQSRSKSANSQKLNSHQTNNYKSVTFNNNSNKSLSSIFTICTKSPESKQDISSLTLKSKTFVNKSSELKSIPNKPLDSLAHVNSDLAQTDGVNASQVAQSSFGFDNSAQNKPQLFKKSKAVTSTPVATRPNSDTESDLTSLTASSLYDEPDMANYSPAQAGLNAWDTNIKVQMYAYSPVWYNVAHLARALHVIRRTNLSTRTGRNQALAHLQGVSRTMQDLGVDNDHRFPVGMHVVCEDFGSWRELFSTLRSCLTWHDRMGELTLRRNANISTGSDTSQAQADTLLNLTKNIDTMLKSLSDDFSTTTMNQADFEARLSLTWG